MAKTPAQLDRDIARALHSFEVGDRVSNGKRRGSAEYDTGTVRYVMRAAGSDRGADLVQVYWDRAKATYDDDARSLTRLR